MQETSLRRDHAKNRGRAAPAAAPALADRLAAVDWAEVAAALDAAGNAVLPGLLSKEDCEAMRSL